MAQNVFEKIKNSDLSAMSVADFDRLFAEIAKAGGKPRNMKKADYDAFIANIFAAREAAVMRENSQQQALAAADNKTDEPKATDEEKEKFEANVSALSDLDKKYKLDREHQVALASLYVIKEDNKPTHLTEEIIETAKLKVLTDSAENDKPLDIKAYKKAVDKEIEYILGTMLPASANDPKEATDDNRWRKLLEAPYQISHKVAGPSLELPLIEAKAKADSLTAKYGNKNFLAGFTSRLNKVVDSCEKKLGKFFKQTWETVKVAYKQGSLTEALIGGGLAFGSLLAAGTVVGAPISAGLAVYSAWVARKRVKPVIDAYHKEKEINGKDYKFSDFYASHKRDVWKASLYTVAGTAGVIAGVAGAVAPFLNTATDTAVILNGIRGAATTTRLAAIPAATTTPYVIDYFNAETKEDRKQALKNIAIAGGLSGAGLLGAAFGAELIGNANAAEVVSTEGAPADAPHAPVHTEWGNGDDYDWRHPWGGNTGIGDAPADASADGTAGDTAEGSSADGTDAYVHQFETRIPTDAEQAFYEKRLNLILDQDTRDAMIANAQSDEIVHLTKNMSPEQAIHLAVMDKLYYGDDTALKLLLECDEVRNINSEEFFNNLYNKFVTDMSDPRGMGFPTDPNYVADPNIYTKGVDPHCNDNKLISRMIRKTLVNIRENEVINVTPEVTPIVDNFPPITVIDNPTPAPEIVDNPVVPQGGEQTFDIHANNGVNVYNETRNVIPGQTIAPAAHSLPEGNTDIHTNGGNDTLKQYTKIAENNASAGASTTAPLEGKPSMTPDQLAKANATLGKTDIEPSSSVLAQKTPVESSDATMQTAINRKLNGGIEY